MSTFISDIQQWRTHSAFAAHLSRHDPIVCSWVKFVVVHHTWRPLPRDWRGLASMQSLQRYYAQKKWTTGPQLFICVGAPNPAHDGIFQLTPMNVPGTHAGAYCNARSIGVEVVGDYDAAPWPAPLADMVASALAHFMNWRSLPRDAIIGHRDCNSPKSCPGHSIVIDDVRDMVWNKRNVIYA